MIEANSFENQIRGLGQRLRDQPSDEQDDQKRHQLRQEARYVTPRIVPSAFEVHRLCLPLQRIARWPFGPSAILAGYPLAD
jgi:hypothetical protein